jgi:hypothetical protein
MIGREDDYFHQLSDDPYWNESSYFSFMVPERVLSGIIYFWHRPNLHLTQTSVSIWDPLGAELHDCVFHEFEYAQPLRAGSEMFDFEADSGLSVRCLEPRRRYRLAYRVPGCELELEWSGFMEPYETKQVAADSLDPNQKVWGKGHYEQLGRVRGHVVVEGERIGVDDFSNMDHTWGIRRGTHDMPRQGYEWACASEDSCFFAHSFGTHPPDDDPLEGTVEGELRGFYTNDGVQASLRSGTRRVLERGPDGRPLRIVVDAVDQLDRPLYADGACVNVLRNPVHGLWLCNWGLMRWEFDGTIAYGETWDLVQLRHNRSYVRRARARQSVAIHDEAVTAPAIRQAG